jgi:acyl-CoA thioesterase
MLALEQSGTGTFIARNLPGPGQVVFGGQILAQTTMAAAASAPGKEVKSLHTVFARGAALDTPLEIVVDPIQDGRTFATLSLTVRQRDRICTRSTALLHAPEPDLIRHSLPEPAASPPSALRPYGTGETWWDRRIVDDVDFNEPDAVGPAELLVWSRFHGVGSELAAQQAMLAFASDGFLIATAMRPHKGVGQSMAHRTISTSVIAQTIDFHEPFSAEHWLLMAHSSPYAGRGRSFGRADVYTEDGRLVASFSQENMIRQFGEGQAPAPGQQSAF